MILFFMTLFSMTQIFPVFFMTAFDKLPANVKAGIQMNHFINF